MTDFSTLSQLKLAPDVFLHQRFGRLIFSNVRAHTHVEVSKCLCPLILSGEDPNDIAPVIPADCWISDLTGISLPYGLWSDPTFLAINASPRISNIDDIINCLNYRLIIFNGTVDQYNSRFDRKTSVLDKVHVGSFYDLVGQHISLELRVSDKWKWWHDTKFTPDGLSLRQGPYKWIQESFFESYFRSRLTDIDNVRVLDFACGNGYYSRKFATYQCSVTAVDIDKNLIDIARLNTSPESDIDYHCAPSPEDCLSFLRTLKHNYFDIVYMSDIFLILYNELSSHEISDYLTVFRRTLKSSGVIILFEPNPIFWLCSRFGSIESPYCVVSEYLNPKFGIAPRLDELMRLFSSNRFCLREFYHPSASFIPDPAFASFARHYPTWDFCVFSPVHE